MSQAAVVVAVAEAELGSLSPQRPRCFSRRAGARRPRPSFGETTSVMDPRATAWTRLMQDIYPEATREQIATALELRSDSHRSRSPADAEAQLREELGWSRRAFALAGKNIF